MYANATMHEVDDHDALISEIHQGSLTVAHLLTSTSVVRDPRRSSAASATMPGRRGRARSARASATRRAVRADRRPSSPVAMPRARASARASSTSRAGPLELRARACARPRRRRRAGGSVTRRRPSPVGGFVAGGFGSGCDGLGARRQRRVLADLAEGDAAVDRSRRPPRRRARRAARARRRSARRASRSRRARPGTGGITARRRRCRRPSRLTFVPSRSR